LSVQAKAPNPKPKNEIQRTSQGDVPIYSDLNGDRNPDQVRIIANNKSGFVHIRFAKGESKLLSFESEGIEDGQLYAEDIDNDSAVDLIWIVHNQPDRAVIWLGDGRGNFFAVKDISPYKANLAHLFIDPFAPGVSTGFGGTTPGCVSEQWTDFQVLFESAFSSVPALETQNSEYGIPAKELDSSLAQLQVRPPPTLS
jgi:hypothetical protein